MSPPDNPQFTPVGGWDSVSDVYNFSVTLVHLGNIRKQ